MKKFEIRLADQQCRNHAHLVNLDRFFRTERFAMLPQEQQKLMIEEFRVKEQLDAILIRRMELLGLPVCN
ncbi:MAG: hypothetical protein K2H38_10415 [Muribaculaceae bacterium]|nr:hypothetical protein [Muribaculaceae bacterium]